MEKNQFVWLAVSLYMRDHAINISPFNFLSLCKSEIYKCKFMIIQRVPIPPPPPKKKKKKKKKKKNQQKNKKKKR